MKPSPISRHFELFNWLAVAFCLIFSPLSNGPANANKTETKEIERPKSRIFRTGNAPHPIIVVEADVYVNRLKMVVKFRSLGDDLELIQGVEALEDGIYDPEELHEATEDHAKYLAEHIMFRDGEGELMKGKLTSIQHIEVPEEGIKAGTLTDHKMEFDFEFVYDNAPEFITIEHSMGSDGTLLPAELKVLMKQAGSDVPYSQMLKPKKPDTFQFDWSRPVLNEAASDNEWQQWFDAQREKSLGLMQYSAVYSFLYINRFDVRHEVLVPLATLTTMMDVERADPSFLEVEEQDKIAEKIKELFSGINPIVIDGVEVKPVFDRIDFYGLNLKDLAAQTERKRVSVANGRAGVIMSFSTKGSPTTVELTWNKFNNVVLSVDSIIIAEEKVDKTEFSKFLANNTYRWQSPDREPLPPIKGIAADIDPEQYKPRKLRIPLISAAMGILLLVSVIAKPFLGSWKAVFVLAAGAMAIGGVGYPFAQKEIDNPFSIPPKFAMPDSEASKVFAQLHKNMYRAFDYRQESDIYDALDKSISGDLLRELYLQINQSLRMKEQGGSIARIDEVNLIEDEQKLVGTLPEEIGFKFRSRWNLIGTVEHWGHVHQRTNQYEAEFAVKLIGDSWKITKFEMLDEPPGSVKTSVRKF